MRLKQTISFIFSIMIITLSFSSSIKAQSIEGDWYGKTIIQGMEIRLTIHVKATDQGYSSTWDSPDQGAFGIVSTQTNFKYPDFSFSHASTGINYSGKANAA